MLIDCHAHTFFSHDGKQDIKDLIAAARDKKLAYLAVTEHLDRDYCRIVGKERFIRQLNLKEYKAEFEKVKDTAEGTVLAFGVECGYSANSVKRYQRDFSRYHFDVIINSVHTISNRDLYFLPQKRLGEKETLYMNYLLTVLDSLKKMPDYDIVGHLGYVARYVNFEDRSLYTDNLKDIVDECLYEIIKRDKTLELNSNVKDMTIPFLPEEEILKRYKELGGQNISFGSDAHVTARLCDKYDLAADIALSLGFTHWTVYKKREKLKIAIK